MDGHNQPSNIVTSCVRYVSDNLTSGLYCWKWYTVLQISHLSWMPLRSHKFFCCLVCEFRVTWPLNTAIFIATKLGRVVTYFEELSLIKLHRPSIRWFCEVTWQIKYFLSSFPLDKWSPNMAKLWLTKRGFHP